MTEYWLPQLFYNKEEIYIMDNEPLNSFFEWNGYDSMQFLKTIGSALVYLAAYISLWPVLLILTLL